MSCELVIKDGCAQLATRALDTIGKLIIRADSIITIDDSLAIDVETSQEVEGVVGHESSAVESVTQQLSNGLNSGCLLEVAFVSLHLCEELLVQGLNISDHTTAGDNASVSQSSRFRVFSGQNVVTEGDSSIGGNQTEVLASDCCNNLG